MKIVVDEKIKLFSNIVNELGCFENIEFIYINSKEIDNNILIDADALFIRSTTIVNKSLLKNTRVKLVGSATAGLDHLDTNYLHSEEIKWFYSPGCNSSSVVHYVLAAIAHLDKINIISKESNTIGIIGCGSIGSKLHLVLNKLNIKSIVCDPYLKFNHLSSIEEVEKCELISIHTPLSFEGSHPTFDMINKLFFDRSNVKALINTSRGSIVNENDLLKLEHINYVADVWANEPSPNSDIIDNAIIATPHIAGHSHEGKVNGTLNLLLELNKYLNINDESFKKNNESILNFRKKDYLSIDEVTLNDFSNSYNIISESINFKNLSKMSGKSLQAGEFNEIRAKHEKRHDII